MITPYRSASPRRTRDPVEGVTLTNFSLLPTAARVTIEFPGLSSCLVGYVMISLIQGVWNRTLFFPKLGVRNAQPIQEGTPPPSPSWLPPLWTF